jgi:hypothetical protein
MQPAAGLEGSGGRVWQGWRPEKAGRKGLALEPMQHKRQQLGSAEVQPGLSGLDVSIELLGQQPEMMGAGQTMVLGGMGHSIQVWGRWTWQLSRWRQSQQETGQSGQQEFTRSVGKGADPLPNGRGGRTGLGQLRQQAAKAQAPDEVEGDGLLQQAQHVMAVWMQKIRQQAVRPAADFAADPLNTQPVVPLLGAGPTRVGAPADQGALCLAFGMGTAIREGNVTPRTDISLGIVFDRKGEMMYDNHAFGTPLRVVEQLTLGHQGRCLPFCSDGSRLSPPTPGSSSPASLQSRLISPLRRIKQCDHIPLAGTCHLKSNYSIWPRLAFFPSNNVTCNNMG